MLCKLTQQQIQQIEKLINSGMKVVITTIPAHKADSGQGIMIDVPETVAIEGHYPSESVIGISPTLIDAENDVPLDIIARPSGQDPVSIATLIFPQGKYLSGLILEDN